MYVCEKKRGREKKGRQASREVHCEHANFVDHKQGHKDVMKLNFQNISAGAFTLPFFCGVDPVPRKFDS